MIKMFVSDLDSTLLTHENGNSFIKEDDLEAIRKLHQNNIKLVVASGRMLGYTLRVLNEYKLDLDVIGTNGATAYIDKQLLLSHLLDNKTVKKAFAYLVKEYPEIFIKVSSPDNIEYSYDTLKRIRKNKTDSLIGLEEALNNDSLEMNKIVISIDDEKKFCAMMEDFRNRFSDYFEINQSTKIHMDVTVKGIDKGTTVKELIKSLGYVKEDVASIGDSPNDISMFKYTGISFAMANGHQDVKDNADHIVDSFAQAVQIVLNSL